MGYISQFIWNSGGKKGTQVGKREAMYWAPLEIAMKVSTQAVKKEWIEGR